MHQAQRVMGLLMRHMNDVASTLHDAPEQYEPLIQENPNNGDSIPIIDEWCLGFMTGVGLDSTGWLPITIGHPDWLSTIILYGTEEGWEQLARKNLPIEEHRLRAAGLAQTVRTIYAHFRDQRRAGSSAGATPVVRRQPMRNIDKVGRNDPCPCGSGKKYKHCHGGPTQLH